MATNGSSTPRAAAPPTALWSVLCVTWLSSLGTAVGWTGVFFVAERSLRFTATENLLLAVSMGAAYTLVAAMAGRIERVLHAPGKRISPRLVLVVVLAIAGAVALVPGVVPTRAGVWAFGVPYAMACGVLWPRVEAYVGGGRRGRALRHASGAFNIAWSSSVIVAMWAIGPMMRDHAHLVLPALAPLHWLTIAFVLRFRRAPGAHEASGPSHTSDEHARLARLLGVFRGLLLLSYLLHGGLTPMLPQLMQRLEIAYEAKPIVASVWMVARLGAFVVMSRWHGWHGRVRTSVWSAALMLAGCALALGATTTGAMLAGLGLFGLGIGAVYAAAIYYAFEHGDQGADAGGRHETMIGMGYTGGPLLGLALAGVLGL